MPEKIVIYTTNVCPFCHAAKEYLKSKKVDFKEIDVSHDEATRQKLVEMSGQETVPQIFKDGKSIGGYQDLVRYYQDGHKL